MSGEGQIVEADGGKQSQKQTSVASAATHSPVVKPRLLDLFCGAGGATKGYQLAGFYVVGVDIVDQPRYCGDEFFRYDALSARTRRLLHSARFDAIHASPPCQAYSTALKHMSAPQPELIEPVRNALIAYGTPWVIENVEGAPLPRQDTLDGRYGLELCGTMFGSRVYRHRLFETSFPVSAPRGCDHRRPAMNHYNARGRRAMYEEFGRQNPDTLWNRELGVPWMRGKEGGEAIPPAYTELIGHQLMAHLEARVAA